MLGNTGFRGLHRKWGAPVPSLQGQPWFYLWIQAGEDLVSRGIGWWGSDLSWGSWPLGLGLAMVLDDEFVRHVQLPNLYLGHTHTSAPAQHPGLTAGSQCREGGCWLLSKPFERIPTFPAPKAPWLSSATDWQSLGLNLGKLGINPHLLSPLRHPLTPVGTTTPAAPSPVFSAHSGYSTSGTGVSLSAEPQSGGGPPGQLPGSQHRERGSSSPLLRLCPATNKW